jgi:hypothetical protein
MRALSNADFLSLWESGRELHPLDQGLLAIHTAFPESNAESVADWPLGRRNRALAELRCTCFGSALQGWTDCSQCGEKLEFKMDGRVLAEQHAAEQHVAQMEHGQAATIVVDGRTFRLPTSRDLARIAGEHEPSRAALRLLEGCELESAPGERESSEEYLEKVGERMAAADPLAEIVVTFECPVCGDSRNEVLDLPVFLWAEIEARVKRLLLEIHRLASAYGWSEGEILALSEARRQLYLEMVQA